MAESREALVQASGFISGNMTTFSSVFAPFPTDPSKTINEVIDALTAALSFGMAFIWSACEPVLPCPVILC